MEIPPSRRRTPSVASSNNNVENLSTLAREKMTLFEKSEINNDLDNEGSENECLGLVNEEFCDENGARRRVNSHGKRYHCGGSKQKKRCVRKRRVTANLAGTKYDIGKKNMLKLHVSFGNVRKCVPLIMHGYIWIAHIVKKFSN